MTSDSLPSSGFTLATIPLRVDRDLVSLSRRTRAAGEDFGLPDREIRSLSTATYAIARAILTMPGVTAEIRLGDGPSLEVAFRAPLEHGPARAGLVTRITRLAAALQGIVDEIAVEERPGDLALSVRAPFPTEAVQRYQTRATTPSPGRPSSDLESIPASELRQRYADLEQAFQELQLELQETNRGVVALYAELEAQAENLRQAEDRLRLLLDSVEDYAICMLTPNGAVASWNAGAERLFGYAADEIMGRDVGCFYPAGEREIGLPAEHLLRAEADGRVASEGLRVRNSGSAFDAHVILTAVRAGRDRELRGFSLVVRDITERTRLETNLRRRAEELAAANRAKEDFLATLSHELRTPLNAMLGWTRLLRTGKLDEAAMARALQTIERNAQAQEQLIADILDVSRIVTGKLRLEVRPIDVTPVVHAALDAVGPAAEAKGIHLDCTNALAGPVLGDPDRLQQVVWNLLVNAIKFTPPGGRITVHVAREGPHAVITVADTGEGIAPDLLPFVFDRFTQGDPSVTRPHGGLGLGLSIVRHIVELHGGLVQVASDGPGSGATFTVRLPLRAVHHVPAEPPASVSQPLAGVKVLLVDDDPDARDVVTTALADCGARTAAVASARDALQILPEFRPDVLVSDLAMPEEDGYSLIRRVRAIGTDGLADIPAVALTAYAQPENRRRALSAGFQSFVPKPVEIEELAEIVRTLAGRRAV